MKFTTLQPIHICRFITYVSPHVFSKSQMCPIGQGQARTFFDSACTDDGSQPKASFARSGWVVARSLNPERSFLIYIGQESEPLLFDSKVLRPKHGQPNTSK
jgi:hypothetical protein